MSFLNATFPKLHGEIKRVFAEGDYVIVHAQGMRVPRGSEARRWVDIFKIEDGKIVEHWDVTKLIPENAVNQNGIFQSVSRTFPAIAPSRSGGW